MLKVVSIYRETKNAGKPRADNEILDKTGTQFSKRSFETFYMAADDFLANLGAQYSADIILSMARGPQINSTLALLQRQTNVFIVNPPEAVSASLSKVDTYRRLDRFGVLIPKCEIWETEALQNLELKGKQILKSAYGHDMWFVVQNASQLEAAMNYYQKKGIEQVIKQDFILGVDIKFYGIGDRVILPESADSLPCEILNKIPIAVEQIRKATSLDVFGGDLIADVASNKLYCVDANDWPSFGTLANYSQSQAAQDIATHIIDSFNAQRSNK
ncbi:MAG: hypothetical protein WC449_01720 [Candidatus Paceibacterota bacterium]